MLVLSRQRDEVIVIGNNLIRITVVDIRGDKVRIGFEAPKELSIHRAEVFDAIRREGSDNRQIRGALAGGERDTDAAGMD